jgi:stage III sporulation protein SpoIIIAA
MKAIFCVTENHSIEAVVVDELGEHAETQTLRVHLGDSRQVIRRPSDAQG